MRAGRGQRVDVPPDPARARLRTGKPYLLVIPTHHPVYAGWDKSRYLPGETARLLVRGFQEGQLELIVERAEEGGAWGEAGRIQAPAADGVAEAEKPFAPLPAPRRAEGHLTRASFDRPRFSPGDAVGLEILAAGLEGEKLAVTVEREAAPGAWETAASLAGTIAQGRCELRWSPPPTQSAPGIEVCVFEGGGPARGMAVLLARGPKLEGAQLSFELEREEARGVFAACGNAVATVREGVARACISLEEPALPATGGARQRGALAEEPRDG